MIGVSGKDKTLVITPQGEIGIGTTVPLGVLDIRGGDVYIEGNVYPSMNSVFNLGSSSNRWKDLYLSGNSINLGGLVLSKSVTNELQIKDEQGNLKNISIDSLNTIDIVASNITTSNLKCHW